MLAVHKDIKNCRPVTQNQTFISKSWVLLTQNACFLIINLAFVNPNIAFNSNFQFHYNLTTSQWCCAITQKRSHCVTTQHSLTSVANDPPMAQPLAAWIKWVSEVWQVEVPSYYTKFIRPVWNVLVCAFNHSYLTVSSCFMSLNNKYLSFRMLT